MVLDFLFRAIRELERRRNPIAHARNLGVRIGADCRLIGRISFGSEPFLIEIGDHVSITEATFITHDGGAWVVRAELPEADVVDRIVVGNNVFIGANAIILPGVTIGDNCVIGAGSVVTKAIPAGSVAAGVPARRIKSIEDYKAKVAQRMLPTALLPTKEKHKWFRDHFGLAE